MAEPFFRMMEMVVPPVVAANGIKNHVPRPGEHSRARWPLIALNHTSYVDWHRIWPKDHPKRLFRTNVPIMVTAGAALPATGNVEHLNDELRRRMNSLLCQVQEEYPHPEGQFWVPRRLGGSAPTPDESKELRVAELAERARQKGARGLCHRQNSRGGPPR